MTPQEHNAFPNGRWSAPRSVPRNRVVQFKDLDNGDCFIAVGLLGDVESCHFRKTSDKPHPQNNCHRVQEGTWSSFPPDWPVRRTDSVKMPVVENMAAVMGRREE